MPIAFFAFIDTKVPSMTPKCLTSSAVMLNSTGLRFESMNKNTRYKQRIPMTTRMKIMTTYRKKFELNIQNANNMKN